MHGYFLKDPKLSHFSETSEQMPIYAKFTNEPFYKKRRLVQRAQLNWKYDVIQSSKKSFSLKFKHPESFIITITLGRLSMGKTSLNLGTNTKLMLLFFVSRIGEVKVKLMHMTLQLVDKLLKFSQRVVENMLIKFIFLTNFVIVNIEEDSKVSIILGRPFITNA